MEETTPAPQERPKVGLGVFVIRPRKDDEAYLEFLLGKRKSEFGKGKWSLPGGHLEFGEEWGQCAARELLEETGINLTGWAEDFEFIGATNDIHEGRHYVTLYMGIEVLPDMEAKNLEPDKCEGWDWFTLDLGALPKDLWEPVRSLIITRFGRICAISPPF